MEEQGRTQFTDEVFVEIARTALRSVNEVSRQEKKGTLAELTQLVSERIAPQIIVKRVARTDDTQALAFDMKLTLIYGVRIPDVVEKVRKAVITEIEALTGYPIDRIDILVEKLIRPETIEDVAATGKEV